VNDDDGRAVLAAYLPANEPVETPVAEVVARARAVRRRRWTVLASAASVVAVLATSAVAIFLGSGRSAGPAVPVSGASRQPGPSSAPTSSTQAAAPCDQESRSNDAGAKAWAQWVRGKVAQLHPQAGPVEWIRMCELDFGHGLVAPPHVMNSAIFALPLQPRPGDTGKPTDSLTAVTDRWERLPNQYRTPCRDDLVTEHVVCHERTLADGSRLVQRDFFDLLIQGDPNDPSAKRDKHAVRDVTRILPDGRTVSLGLVYNMTPPWKRSFDRHVLSLDQLTAIVTDPAALRYFPRR
jgi:hypothetical protein